MRERGSASVEFALVLPLVLLTTLALLQIGLVGKDALVVSQAAREAAREAAVTTDDARVRDAAVRGGRLDPSRADVDVSRSGGAGDPVTVRVRYRSPLVVPFLAWLLPGEVTLRSSATMRQEAVG